jgi:hypothetical protein
VALLQQIEELKWKVSEGSLHPMQAKKDLAKRIIADFHSSKQEQKPSRIGRDSSRKTKFRRTWNW